MRLMSGFGPAPAVWSALLVEISLRGLSAFVCDGIDPGLGLKWYAVVLRKGL